MASKLNLVPAPLPESSLHFLHQSAHGLTAEQLHWASGYMAGLAQAHVPAVTQEPLAKSATTARTAPTITVLYGSQTGNGRSVAEQLAKEIEAAGARTNVVSMLDYRTKDLKNEQYLALVVSTHGEGEPPDDAEDFYAYLMGSRVPALSGLRYSVLALGDSSYEYFCETGRRMDERLQALGAQALTPRAECDVDFNDDAGLWSQGIVAKIREDLEDAVPDSAIVTPLRAVPVSEPVSREHPLSAEVVSVQQITGRGSDKDVRHIEIDFGGKHLSYQPGDALGVLAENPAALVNDIIAALGADPAQRVTRKETSVSLVQALSTQFEITRLNRKTLTAYAEITNNETLQTLLLPDNRSELMQLIDTHQLIDLLTRYPARIPLSAQQFVDMLRPLTPRLYSIASSPAAYEGEVHLTVAVVEYQAFGHTRVGAASHYLGRHLAAGDRVAIYAEANPGFRLPPDEADMIMIGPGTGVAPFRAFLDERAARGASGSNWLFFGDRTFADDFLYQVEWQRHLKSGVLSYLDVAFSRDQSDKIYVQHRLKQRGKQLYRWLNEGAHIYVCGDAKNMAPDVHAALLELIQEHGNLSVTEAEALLKTLRRQGRYHRDVY